MDKNIINKLVNFFSRFKHQVYKKGEILIRAEDEPPGIFYLKKGQVKVYLISRQGEELTLNIFKPGAFFPMSWAMNNTPNDYFYEAMTDIELWRAPKEEVISFIKQEPEVLYDLLSRVYKGLDGVLIRLTYLMRGSAYTRLVVELMIYAKRFGKTRGNRVEIEISEKDLAALSGMSRETVSREMKILKNKHLIDFKMKRLVINDLARLKNELQTED